MSKTTIVLYPSPAIGHLISMVELGKLILNQNPSFSIAILITPPPYKAGSTTPYINNISKTNPSIIFHHLPPISLPDHLHSSTNHETLTFQTLTLNNPNVYQALQSIFQSSAVRCLIIDFFCFSAMEVTQELQIPTYYFFTSGASVFSIFSYFPKIHRTTTESFKDLKCTLQFPGFPQISPLDMPKPMLDRTDYAYANFLNFALTVPKSQGIIVNSFESLEPRGVKALSDGLCVPDGPTPPIYYIGPLIKDEDPTVGGDSSEAPEWLKWLDTQPSRSVVFLCFGSLGLFRLAQLSEIAVGLEKSGQRFLWVVRSPPADDNLKSFLAPPERDLDTLLPDGFLARTTGRGLVVKSWIPQISVLNHGSVGGFVTHCGWNSTLEAVCAGVPMVAWPLYAEQRLNKVLLVEEIKLALPMNENEDGFVNSIEVERRINELMRSEKGKTIRERVMKMCVEAKVAMSEGGSSKKALNKLIQLWCQE